MHFIICKLIFEWLHQDNIDLLPKDIGRLYLQVISHHFQIKPISIVTAAHNFEMNLGLQINFAQTRKDTLRIIT